MFVFISDLCKEQIQEQQISDKVLELQNWVENGDFQKFTELFEIFVHPYYVRKKVAYQYRLLARHSTVTLNEQNYGVVVFFACFARGDKAYDDFYFNPARQGDFLYNQQHLDDKLTDYVKARLTAPTLNTEPVVVNEALAQSYFIKTKTNLLYFECPPKDTYLESRLWRYQVAPSLSNDELVTVFDALQTGLEKNSTQHFVIKNFDLVFEPSPTPTLRTLGELPSPLDRHLPSEFLLDKERWCHWQKDKTSCEFSPYLNDFGNQVCQKIFDENSHFPLLINASALQGKSTLMAMLAVHYHYQDEPNADGLPYLLCYNNLNEATFNKHRLHTFYRYFQYCREEKKDLDYNECITIKDLIRHTIPDLSRLPFKNSIFIDENNFYKLWRENPAFEHAPFNGINVGLIWHILQIHIKGGFEFDGISLYPDQDLFKLIYRKVWLDWYKPLCQNGYFDIHDVLTYINKNYRPARRYKAILIDDADQYSKLALYTVLRHSIYYDMPKLFYQSPIILMGNDEYNIHWQEMAMAVFKYCQDEQNYAHTFRAERLTIKQWQNNLQALINQKRQSLFGVGTKTDIKEFPLNFYFIDSHDKKSMLSLCNNKSIAWYVHKDRYAPYRPVTSYLATKSLFDFSIDTHRSISLDNANHLNSPNPQIALLAFGDAIHLHYHTIHRQEVDFLLMRLQKVIARSIDSVFIIASDDEFAQWQYLFDELNLPIQFVDAKFINPNFYPTVSTLAQKRDELLNLPIVDKNTKAITDLAEQYAKHFLFKENLELLLYASEIKDNYQEFFSKLTKDLQKEWAFGQLWNAKHKKVWFECTEYCPKSLTGNLLALQLIHHKPFNYTIDKAYQLALQAYLEQYESPIFGDYWRTLITPLLELFLAKRVENFTQIDLLFRQIDDKQYYVPFLTLADIYDEYGNTERAIHYWHLSESLNTKILPPDRYYQLKLKSASTWQETLVPLLHLNQLGEFMNTLGNNDINELTLDDWQKILPYLEEEQTLEAVLTYFLPKLHYADLLKKVLEHCEYNVSSRFETRLQRLITLKACLESDWEVVIERLNHYAPANGDDLLSKLSLNNQVIQIKQNRKQNKVINPVRFYPPQEEVVDILYALNLNPIFKTLSDTFTFEDYRNNETVINIFSGIRKIFKLSDIESDDKVKYGCWNIKFPEVQALMVLLEKSNQPYDAVEVYREVIYDAKNSANLKKIAKERAYYILNKLNDILETYNQELDTDTAEECEDKDILRQNFKRNQKILTDFKKNVYSEIDFTSEYATLSEVPPLKSVDEILKRILTLNNQEQKEIARLQKEQERAKKERLEAAKKAEKEKLEAEKAEQKRLEQEKAEQERLEQERLEKEHLEQAKQHIINSTQETLIAQEPSPINKQATQFLSKTTTPTPLVANKPPAKATSEFGFFGWRIFVNRLHKRLNLECTDTGQRLSLHWHTHELQSDWLYHQDGNCFMVMGLPLVLEIIDDKVRLHHSEHQIDLWV